MYRIFLVDDDDIERRGICALPLFEQLELEIVGDAWNGKEALEGIRQARPDIVLSDVRMPVMDGLALAGAMGREMPEIKLILMSGYEDFEAVRQAIQLGVNSFLTKPLNIEEFKSTLIRTMDELDVEHNRLRRREKVNWYMDRLVPVLRERVVRDLMLGVQLPDDNELHNEVAETGIFRGVERVCVFGVQIDNWESIREESYNPMDVLKEMEGRHDMVPVGIQGGLYAIMAVLPPEYDDEMAFNLQQRHAGELLRKLGEIHCRATVGVSQAGAGPADLNRLYRQACLALRKRAVYGPDRVYWFDGQDKAEGDRLPDAMKTANLLERALMENNRDEAHRVISRYFSDIQAAGAALGAMRNAVLELLFHIVVMARRDGKDLLGIFEGKEALYPFWDPSADGESLKRMTLEAFDRALASLYLKPLSQSEKLVDSVQKMIEKRYSENISTDMIAKELFVAPSYLRRVFKNLTGQTIQDSILAVRMKRARELLLDPGMKVYEIAQAVGFESQSYFGIVFKKYYGVTTGEYRNALL